VLGQHGLDLGQLPGRRRRSFWLSLINHFGKIEAITGMPDRRPSPAEVQATTVISLPVKYYRAIAKIAFDFFVSSFAPPLTGFEACFDDIKRFIFERGRSKKIRQLLS
jgi:hypothetical protein